jgi:hypothetical protein
LDFLSQPFLHEKCFCHLSTLPIQTS